MNPLSLKYTKNVTIILLFTLIFPVLGQDISVPIRIHLPILLKILTFDRNFKNKVGDEIVIGIIYQRKFNTSLNAKNNFVDELNKSGLTKLEGLDVKFTTINIDTTDLETALLSEKIDVFYVTPLRAKGIEEIKNKSRKYHIITMSGVEEYIKFGLTVGVGIKGNKPQILINLDAAKLENIDFSSQLLKLAQIYY
ncbi:YfiR family protein [candidate division KSB1 bacterium]|nr:YfiR family protein [candidate division KSB1 bacterium]